MSEPTERLIESQPSRWRARVLMGLAFVLVLAIGFALCAFLFQQDEAEALLDPEEVVLYETASSSFPVAGGAFTPSFYDENLDRCDLEQFRAYMDENPERKQAWMEIRGLSTEEEYEALLGRLVEARVAEHTPVLNHGYRDGEWFEVHSVLAPGTPVLIDPPPEGEEGGFYIVMKCTCGNPILPPACPPNCEDGPTPSPSATPTGSPEETPRETPTTPPRRTPVPTPTPERTEEPTPEPTPTPTPERTVPTPTPTPVLQ